MNESMRAKLAQLARRLQEIDTALSMPDAARDLDQFRRLSRERAEIEPVVARYHEYVRAQADLVAAQDLIGDPEMRTLAEEESGSVRRRLETLESDLQRLLLPVDPNDDRNIFLEIRAGSGGEESALFAADLLRMYLRYAERQGWRSEIMSESQSDLGGFKEVVVRLENPSGARGLAAATEGVYGQLRFESGGHRVQRVPAT